MDQRFDLPKFHENYQRFLQYSPNPKEDLSIFFSIFRMFLPAFYPNRHIPYSSFEEDKIIDIESEKLIIPLDKIYGDGWLFPDKFTGDRPVSERMGSLITMTPDSKYPTIWGMKLSDGSVFINDGNHRLYAAYLLGWDTIRITCDQLYQGEWNKLIARNHNNI